MENVKNITAEVLTTIMPRIMADLKKRSPALREDLHEVTEDLTDAILDAAMPNIRDLRL